MPRQHPRSPGGWLLPGLNSINPRSLHPPIILASSSPYRRQVLQQLGLEFISRSPDIDESISDGESAMDLVKRLSLAKARAVAKDCEDALVIGSDQVSEQNGRIVGKPLDHADAVDQLTRASGSVSRLYSGVALINTVTGTEHCEIAVVKVKCRILDHGQIERYLATDQPYDCCGSIKVESLGISLLESIESDDPNAITGLPVIKLVSLLAREGVSLP